MRALLFAFTLCTVAGAVGAAEKFSSSNVDVRTVIGFKASEAAVQKVLPSGWEVASPTSGPLKGFNVSINFIETITAQDAEGKSVEISSKRSRPRMPKANPYRCSGAPF